MSHPAPSERRVKFRQTDLKDQYDAWLVTGTTTSDVRLGTVMRMGPGEWHAYRTGREVAEDSFATRGEAGRYLGDRLH